MRWVLIDEVLEIEKGNAARTRSHIPVAAFSPELAMIEMMAETGALLVGAETDFKEDLVFAKMERANFYDGWRPGEAIEITASSENLRPEGAWLQASVEGPSGRAADGRFLLTTVGHFINGRTEPLTFHEAFMNYFQIRSKVQ